jgi:HEAT repeat protein
LDTIVLKVLLWAGLCTLFAGQCSAADDVPTLIAHLKSDDLRAQFLACEELAALGGRSIDALPALVEILENGPTEAREAATRVVAAIGPDAKAAIPALVLLLRDRRYWVREEAAAALVATGPAALPQVIRAMKSDSARARAAATRAASDFLSDSELILPALTDALKDPDPRVRATAAAGLGRYGSEAVPVLAAAAGDKDSCVAVAIAEALKALHAGPSVAVNALVRLLDDPQSRLSAVRGLQQYGVESRRAIPALVRHYPANTEDERTGFDDPIDEALKHIGPPHIDDVAALEELFHNERTDVRTLAARELGLMGDFGATRDRAAAALEPLLDDPEAFVRSEVARSLWLLQRDATRVLSLSNAWIDHKQYDAVLGLSDTLEEIGKPAVPTVVRVLQSDDDTARRWAAWTLVGIGRSVSESLPALINALSDRDSGVRDAVSRAIGQLGPEAAQAVAALIAAVQDGRLNCSQLAVAVTNIGPPARSAMPLLVAGLNSDDEPALSRIIHAICSVGADDEATVDTVNKAIEDGRIRRAWAIDSFARLKGAAAAKAMLVLVEALEGTDDYTTRQVAAAALGQIGPPAKSALPKLRFASGDKEFPVRLQAALAIWRLTGETTPMQAALTSAFHDQIETSDYNTWYRRRETLCAVRDMGPAAAPLLPALQAAMKDSPDDLSIEFIDVLAHFGKAGHDALPTLIAISKNTDWVIRRPALDAIEQIREQFEESRR